MQDISGSAIAPPGVVASESFRLTAPSLASRATPRRSRGSHCGSIVAFSAARAIHYESKLEANVASLMLARPDVIDLREQVGPIRYVDAKGAWRSTYLDFVVEFANGRKIGISAKPWALAEKQEIKATLKLLAEQVPRAIATEIWLMTERNVPADAVANARLILSVRRDPENGDSEAVAATAATLEGRVTIADLCKASGLESGFRAVVRCIDRGILTTTGRGRIGPTTQVVRAGPTHCEASP